MRCLISALILALAPGSLCAQAPAGYRTFVDKDTGLRCYRPSNFSEIPVPPPEQVIRARFLSNARPKARKVGKLRLAPKKADISIFMFREGKTTPKPGETAGAEVPSSLREQIEKRSAVSSWDEFRKKRLKGLNLLADDSGKHRWSLEWQKRNVGYIAFVRKGPYLMGALGRCGSTSPKQLKIHVQRMVSSMELDRGDRKITAASADLDRLYKNKKLRAIEHRKKVRLAMARGWKALDTPNYILVYHSRNEKLVNKIARDIEAMRAFYAGMFPPVREVDEVSVVRICKNRKEYLSYGGHPSSGGYWNFVAEELVFFDYRETMRKTDHTYKGPLLSDKDSLLVLYHEAFHQYIFYAVGEIRPHDWFNEGLGDYYSGAIIPQYGKKVSRIGPSRWRIALAMRQCKEGKGFIPLQQLLHAEHKEYYDRRRAPLYYASGWSFCYFLREAQEVQRNPRWAGLLDSYFNHLKDAYKQEMAERSQTLADKQAAAAAARKTAIKKCLAGIDLDELEAAWVRFISRLKNPWPNRTRK